MNRIDPGPFAEAFTAWVRETWPDKPDFVAIPDQVQDQVHGCPV